MIQPKDNTCSSLIFFVKFRFHSYFVKFNQYLDLFDDKKLCC
jgi:hypothetical protein